MYLSSANSSEQEQFIHHQQELFMYTINTATTIDNMKLLQDLNYGITYQQDEPTTDHMLLASGYYPNYNNYSTAVIPAPEISTCHSNVYHNYPNTTNAILTTTNVCTTTNCANVASPSFSDDTITTSSSPIETIHDFESQQRQDQFLSSQLQFNDNICYDSFWSCTPSPSFALNEQVPDYFSLAVDTCINNENTSNSTDNNSSNNNSSTAQQKHRYKSNRLYSCHFCNRSFARKHDLQRHIRVHTGDKPYVCPCCRKAFARTDALKRHLRMEDKCRCSQEVQEMRATGKRRFRNL